MLDVHRLRIFRAVVASGSMNQAAANLGYTASAVSQHVAALQRETQLQLVERDGRGIRPTDAGRRLAAAADEVLGHLAALDAVVEDLRSGRVGALSVSYFTSVGAAWMPGVVATMTREFPELRLDLRLLERADGPPAAPDVEVVVVDDVTTEDPAYDVHPLLEEPYVVVLPATHRLGRHAQVPLGELADEPWVDSDPAHGTCRAVVLDACSSVGFRPRFHVEAHDYLTAISFVAAGVGVTVMPRLGVGTSLPRDLRAIPVVDPVPMRRIAVRVRTSLRSSRAAGRIVELLEERAAATAAAPPAGAARAS
jgi:DNA-binding transcriptional LysR family regulator